MKKVVTSYELVTLMIEAITNIRALIASIKS